MCGGSGRAPSWVTACACARVHNCDLQHVYVPCVPVRVTLYVHMYVTVCDSTHELLCGVCMYM